MTIHFRRGETETMGIIEKASYEITGNDVIVTTESGPFKGTAFRYTMTGPNSARSEAGVLVRVR